MIGRLLCPFLQLFARNSVKMVENALVQTSANANRDIPDSGVKFVSSNRLHTSRIIFLKSGALYSPIHASKSVFVWKFHLKRSILF